MPQIPPGPLTKIITQQTWYYEITLPPPPIVLSVNFNRSSPMAQLYGTVNLAPQADTTIISRKVKVTFDGGTPSVVVDMINPAQGFMVPPGETSGVATPMGDINPVGTGPPGLPFPFPIPPEATVPPASVVTSVTFSPPPNTPVINPLEK